MKSKKGRKTSRPESFAGGRTSFTPCSEGCTEDSSNVRHAAARMRQSGCQEAVKPAPDAPSLRTEALQIQVL